MSFYNCVRSIFNSDTNVTTRSKIPIRQTKFLGLGYVSEFIGLIDGSSIPTRRGYQDMLGSKHILYFLSKINHI